jgi:hypothetical protein
MWRHLRYRLSRLRGILLAAPFTVRGYNSNRNWPILTKPQELQAEPNPLRDFFNGRREGRGVWKCDHYFDIYHRHLSRFRGRDVHVLEIGVYSGGSLDMWREYFGSAAHIYGVDIEPACKSYEDSVTKVFVGDQADRQFWERFRKEVPVLDVVIDDGGHMPEQQIASLEELLPHLRLGGVYICEDVTQVFNPFCSYMNRMVQQLNAYRGAESNVDDCERRLLCKTTLFQSAVRSIHFYPLLTVVERTRSPVAELVAPKHGTEWQPFLR